MKTSSIIQLVLVILAIAGTVAALFFTSWAWILAGVAVGATGIAFVIDFFSEGVNANTILQTVMFTGVVVGAGVMLGPVIMAAAGLGVVAAAMLADLSTMVMSMSLQKAMGKTA